MSYQPPTPRECGFLLLEEMKNHSPSLPVVKELLADGAYTNLRDAGQSTPALLAAVGGHASILKALINADADIELADSTNMTPLNAAARYGHRDCFDLLASARAKPDIKDSMDYTALIWAAFNGHTHMVKSLIDMGANPELTNNDGKTARQLAHDGDHHEIVALLDKAVIDWRAKSWKDTVHACANTALSTQKPIHVKRPRIIKKPNGFNR